MTPFGWTSTAQNGTARAGTLHTAHGDVPTPVFMPVGTAATVKAMTADAVRRTGARIVLGNTYHLMLRPGAERVARLGGLHRMMDWPGPILTDSGGFQIMSLDKLRTLDADGVTFRSHLDGSKHRLTPERAVQIQGLLDATITMVLDECTAFPATHAQAEASMELSMRWAARCRAAFLARPGYALFGIVQGGVYPDLRRRSAEALLAVGFEVLRGVDMFDCVMPTRAGRTGRAFTSVGVLNLRNACHAEDAGPLDPACTCPACARHSRAYLHHLFRCQEMLGPMLLTWHNLTYYQSLMAGLRRAIVSAELSKFAADVRAGWTLGISGRACASGSEA